MLQDCPGLMELKSQVSAKLDHAITNFTDLKFLAMVVGEKLQETLHPEIFQELWGIDMDSAKTTRISTLHLLAEYLNFSNFTEFIQSVQQYTTFTPCIQNLDMLSSSQLEKGDHVEIGWGHHSFMYIEYFGKDRFIVKESYRTVLDPGDSFICTIFKLGEALTLHNVCTTIENDLILIIGKKDGIRSIQKI